MLNHCLLHVDYSDDWDQVPAYLPVMTKLLDMRHLTLVYVIETFRRRSEEDTEQARIKTLESLAEDMQEQLAITVDYKLCSGLVVAETRRVANMLKADGIITLNRSHSTGRELFLGNVALNFARMSHLPLLILPLDGEVPSLQAPVILAYDCSKFAEGANRQFAGLLEAGEKGIVIAVDDPEYEPDSTHAGAPIETLVDRYGNAQFVQVSGHPIEEILSAADDAKSPLIVIGKRGNNPDKDMPLGHIAEGVARLSRRPVLLVPRERAILSTPVYS